MNPPHSLQRRKILGALLGCATASIALPARAEREPPRERWLELASLHTGEAVAVAYRDARGYVTQALHGLQRVLRDHRSGEQHPIDARLYDLLADLADGAGVEPRFEIISGYRSPNTNATLHARSNGVAEKSLHVQGKAIDVRLKGVRCDRLGELARAAACGGVGYYRKSDFVHVDTGRVRAWYG